MLFSHESCCSLEMFVSDFHTAEKKTKHKLAIGCITNPQWISSQILDRFSHLSIYFFLSFFPVFSRTKSWAMCQLNHVAWVARRLVRPIWTRCDRNVPNSRWNETLRRNCGRFIGSSSRKATVKVLRNWSESRQRSILQASRNEWDFLCCLFSFPFSLLIASWIMLQLLCLFASHTQTSHSTFTSPRGRLQSYYVCQ